MVFCLKDFCQHGATGFSFGLLFTTTTNDIKPTGESLIQGAWSSRVNILSGSMLIGARVVPKSNQVLDQFLFASA